jgi:tRNA (adenine57-N1/adenine58-N1)-methyltransferase
MKLLITTEGNKFFYRDADLHTKFGLIKKETIEKAKVGDCLTTNTGKQMHIIESSFLDEYFKIKRGPQIIPRKDLGIIIAETGITPNWKVLDVGCGSGAMTLFFANLLVRGKVYSFDIREDHLAIAKANAEQLKLKNIIFKHHDVYESIPLKKLNMILLDLPEPWKTISSAEKALLPGGFLVSYSPTIPQVSDFIEAIAKQQQFIVIKTIEIIEREWELAGRTIRPLSQQIGHSGFITICRKI